MIEAVNSATASAILSRGPANSGEASGNPVPLEALDGAPEAPRAPYVSPYIAIDPNFDRAVLQIRNGDTGEVIRQFPSEGRLQQQAREAARVEQSTRVREIAGADIQAAQQSRSSSAEVITVQDVTSNAPSNQPSVTPQNAINALSAGVQTGQTAQTTIVSVLA